MRFKWKTPIRCVIAVIATITVMYSTAFSVSAAGLENYKSKQNGLWLGARHPKIINIAAGPHPWYAHRWKDGTVELTISKNGGRGIYAIDDSAHGLRTYPVNKSKYQSWYVVRHSDGTISFRNQKTGRCIDSNKYLGVRAIKCYYNSYQRFY
ncbi:hypothetical protein KK120_16975 [Virgibacillus dakarensis]|nr:hypothetical protein [Virgibacillus dakarensis]